MANRTLALLRRLFNWAAERGLLEASPCTHIKAPGREKPRERVLSDHEVRALWTRLDTARMDRRTAAALRLILVTGQRPGEIRAMRWDEVQGAWWTIPNEKTKNETTHRVPLTALALELLGERAALTPLAAASSGWLFARTAGFLFIKLQHPGGMTRISF